MRSAVSHTMGNLLPILFLLVVIGVFAIGRPGLAKYALLLAGSLFLSGCLSLRLGENEKRKQPELAYIDGEGVVVQR
jgi:hypothetical protein